MTVAAMPEPPRIIRLDESDLARRSQAAELMVVGFRQLGTAYVPDRESADEEMRDFSARGTVLLAALDEAGEVIGLIGGTSTYDGHVWELHPLVVRPDLQRRGIGRALVERLADAAREAGAVTLWVGSDDEACLTSAGGIDLYPNPLEHLRTLRNLGGHPFEFYQKCGFSLVGILPDANGFGKPDLFLTRRL